MTVYLFCFLYFALVIGASAATTGVLTSFQHDFRFSSLDGKEISAYEITARPTSPSCNANVFHDVRFDILPGNSLGASDYSTRHINLAKQGNFGSFTDNISPSVCPAGEIYTNVTLLSGSIDPFSSLFFFLRSARGEPHFHIHTACARRTAADGRNISCRAAVA